MLSQTEENYLKSIFLITSGKENKPEAGINEIAATLDVRPATVNDMVKKLRDKGFVSAEKYGKIKLTESGLKQALLLVRKHRLWETFLYDQLEFSWDEVHEIAEQLEHIQSEKLTEKLDKFLNYPKFDPHGDFIPDSKGNYQKTKHLCLNNMNVNQRCKLVAVKNNTAAFLKYVVKIGLGMSTEITFIERNEFDGSIVIEVGGNRTTVSEKFADNILVTPIK